MAQLQNREQHLAAARESAVSTVPIQYASPKARAKARIKSPRGKRASLSPSPPFTIAPSGNLPLPQTSSRPLFNALTGKPSDSSSSENLSKRPKSQSRSLLLRLGEKKRSLALQRSTTPLALSSPTPSVSTAQPTSTTSTVTTSLSSSSSSSSSITKAPVSRPGTPIVLPGSPGFQSPPFPPLPSLPYFCIPPPGNSDGLSRSPLIPPLTIPHSSQGSEPFSHTPPNTPLSPLTPRLEKDQRMKTPSPFRQSKSLPSPACTRPFSPTQSDCSPGYNTPKSPRTQTLSSADLTPRPSPTLTDVSTTRLITPSQTQSVGHGILATPPKQVPSQSPSYPSSPSLITVPPFSAPFSPSTPTLPASPLSPVPPLSSTPAPSTTTTSHTSFTSFPSHQ